MSRKDKGRIAGHFVPMLIDTMSTAAWRAMSPYARVLYVALKSRYSFKAKNNGRIYLSVRTAAEETGLDKKTIARSFRELSYYGFVMMMNPGCLGVEGRGKAPHWRLTELGYMTDPPTRDFMQWSGEVFHEQKSPEYYKRQERRLAKLRAASKKQNPVPTNGTPCTDQRDIPLYRPSGHSAADLSLPPVHTADPACTDQRDISRLTTRRLEKRSGVQDGKGQAAAVRLPTPDGKSAAKDDDLAFLRRRLDELTSRKPSEGR
jgi:Helix-turn-helix domain